MPLGVIMSQLPYMVVLLLLASAYPQPGSAALVMAINVLTYGLLVSAPVTCIFLPLLRLRTARRLALVGGGLTVGAAWAIGFSELSFRSQDTFASVVFGIGGAFAGGMCGWLFARARISGDQAECSSTSSAA